MMKEDEITETGWGENLEKINFRKLSFKSFVGKLEKSFDNFEQNLKFLMD